MGFLNNFLFKNLLNNNKYRNIIKWKMGLEKKIL